MPTAAEKALQINRDDGKHGTFAEIGAGQEVARWFFHVGGAAGTVAKTISAYDMAVSDSLYGRTERYVSRDRLRAMLDHEWGILLEQLAPRRHASTAFFVFADTVATRSFSRNQDGHGWMGIRFQHQPRGAPAEILLHVRLHDRENVRQQEAVGILGVNLIWWAFHHDGDPTRLVGGLLDDLDRDRVEVDVVRFSGARLEQVDNRLMSLQLVEQHLTEAAMFTSEGEVVQPAEVLHHRPVLVERGSFSPLTEPMRAMLEGARHHYLAAAEPGGKELIVLLEMTLRNLREQEPVDHREFLARADRLGALGHTVMVSRFGHHHALIQELRRHTNESILLAMGAPALGSLFDESYYTDLPGGLLESLGLLFAGDVRLYVYPWREPGAGEPHDAHHFRPAGLEHLYRHLLERGRIVALDGGAAAGVSR